MSFDAEVEVKKLAEEIVHLNSDIARLQRQQSSRKGDPGPKGDSVTGPAGKDAVIKIVQADGKVQIVDMEGKVHAELVSIAGPAGKDAPMPRDGRDGAPGRPGKDSPSLAEIVRGVLQEVKAKL
jgi:hypothetical protein